VTFCKYDLQHINILLLQCSMPTDSFTLRKGFVWYTRYRRHWKSERIVNTLDT